MAGIMHRITHIMSRKKRRRKKAFQLNENESEEIFFMLIIFTCCVQIEFGTVTPNEYEFRVHPFI